MYSRVVEDEIFARLVDGQSLRQICKDDEMPSFKTVMRWLADDKEGIVARYRIARELQAETLVDDIMRISDTGSGDVARDRLSVDSRKWFASKVFPKVYGDRSIHQTQDEEGLKPLNIGLINVPPKVPSDD